MKIPELDPELHEIAGHLNADERLKTAATVSRWVEQLMASAAAMKVAKLKKTAVLWQVQEQVGRN